VQEAIGRRIMIQARFLQKHKTLSEKQVKQKALEMWLKLQSICPVRNSDFEPQYSQTNRELRTNGSCWFFLPGFVTPYFCSIK
jgi:hypothetical protein